MAGIQSSVGLISGLPIQDTVDQLMAISAQPRDRLLSRTAALTAEQTAVTTLTARILGVQLAGDKLGNADLFQTMSATSGKSSVLSATVTGTPIQGDYKFTAVRRASSQQLLSGGLAEKDAALGGGTVTIGFGGFLDKTHSLDLLNSGQGVQRGQIRVTDRSGDSATIDLRYVESVDEVLDAINSASEIDVTAVADGDAIRLVDGSGSTSSNLKVEEVNGGSTAADLGLGSIDVAADEATGVDLVSLYDDLSIDQLNDGNGVSLTDDLADIQITFRDNSTALEIDLSPDDGESLTIADLLQKLNEADPARFSASISASGDQIELTDLTTDAGGTFAVSSLYGGTAAEDLGLTGAASGDTLTGGRLLSGLEGPLLSSLNGGAGLGILGTLSLTDRSGAGDTVDLSNAETLADVIDAINNASVSIAASLNDSRGGILLTDTSGASTVNLQVSNADASETAEALGIATDAAVTQVDGGSLKLQTVSETTLLSSFNGGQGIELGVFSITDTSGLTQAVRLDGGDVTTVGDVLDLINLSSVQVEARINDDGDGIVLIDKADGDEAFTVADLTGGTTAADLHIAGIGADEDVGGETHSVINGSTKYTIELDAEDTLEDLVTIINDLAGPLAAGIFTSGSGQTPYRLMLNSQATGEAGALQVDMSALGLDLTETVAAQDALVVYGNTDVPGGGILISSSKNQLEDVIDGLTINVHTISDDPVTISVARSEASLVSSVELFVDQYNSLRETLEELTYFNETDQSVGTLFGSSETLRIDNDLSSLLTDRYFATDSIRSLREVGIKTKGDGAIEVDVDVLKAAFAADPEAVEEFFTAETNGVAARFHDVIESLAGEGTSLLVNRAQALQAKVDIFNARIDQMNERLERERERLEIEFYRLELAISEMQSNTSFLSALQPITPYSGSSDG
jgi:flagellar hook-associated protein 2